MSLLQKPWAGGGTNIIRRLPIEYASLKFLIGCSGCRKISAFFAGLALLASAPSRSLDRHQSHGAILGVGRHGSNGGWNIVGVGYAF